MNAIVLKGMQIYAEDQYIECGYIKIKEHSIVEIGSLDQFHPNETDELIKVPPSYKAIPGLIDLHVHGASGADMMDASLRSLNTMTRKLPEEGTTSFLATTITQKEEYIQGALVNAGNYICHNQAPGQAEILGIHLEGPFVNKSRAGAQPIDNIINPDLALFKKWNKQARGKIKLVTLAPEQPGGLELVRYLKENNIVASIGHSDATFEEVKQAIRAGVTHVTHLYNQMRGLHHRDPGVVGAAFLNDDLVVELIVDGIHVSKEMVELAYKQKGKERIVLITDAMRAKGMASGIYDLGGQDIIVKDGKAVLYDGTLAGSTLKFEEALRNMVAFSGCSLQDSIRMSSFNQAKQLGVLHRKGSLATRKDADIVILDEDLHVSKTFCRGKLAFDREGGAR